MTTRKFRDPIGGRVAIYRTPTDEGDPDDPNAPCNAPLVSPRDNLDHLFFHSDLDPMEVAFAPVDLTVTHAAIAAGTGSGGVGTVNGDRVFGNIVRTHVLFTHNLGYVPDFVLAYGSNVVHPGFPIQFDSADGRARCITAYATTTQIILHEFGIQTSNAMAAISATYSLLVLRRPPAASGTILYDFDDVTGIVQMARGKFRSDRRYLQVVSGGSPFGFPLGRTIDLRNGAFRSVSPDGTIRDVVPASFRVSFGFNPSPTFGPNGNYNGSFTGTGAVQVQAP